jgi:Tol biopolymer transport system component
LPRRLAFLALCIVGLLAASGAARAANNPKLLWKSLETKHFRISFYSTEDEVAEHVAALAEAIYARLIPAVGWPPSTDSTTEIVLIDQTDVANGSATALPFDAITLYVTAPDDMSPLGDVDDWYLELLTHEFTHILHTDHIEGIPALVNRILGKTLAPNQVQPHWLLEGLAVFEESARTSGGRLRSSMWNMWMRADVLEGNVATLDQFSNVPRRWPQGNIWYLYGSFFMQWIADTFGEQAIRAMIDDYGRQIAPYAINRSIRRATGHTYEEMFPAWVNSMRRSFALQTEAIAARGLREGIRLTHTGNTVEHPRWIPPRAWPEHAGDLLAYIDDGHTSAGHWALPLVKDARGQVIGAREGGRELMVRINGPGGMSFMPDGALAFSSTDITDNIFSFNDLFELPAHQKSASGLDGRRVRWSEGWRALDPGVSPDGRQVVFTTNHRGTTRLLIADVVQAPDRAGVHALANPRVLVPGASFDQAFTPRWAPDGRHVAYSSWEHGGYRDVRIVDTADGSYVDVTHDRAVDGDPVFSADGRWLYFHSDRTGVSNIYAYEVATKRLRQVTNVINGAYQPEPSPDGKSLAYVGYTHDGYDLFVIALDPDTWLEPLPYEETRPAAPPEPPPIASRIVAYNPLHTLMPRAYTFMTGPGNFGQATTISATGSDIAGQHAIGVNLTSEWSHPSLEGSIGYSYYRLPFDMSVAVSRNLSPQTNYSIGSTPVQWIEETLTGSASINYSIPRAFDSQSFNIGYNFSRYAGTFPLPLASLNPYDIPSQPNTRGVLGSIHLGWSYSNAQGYLWSLGSESGITASIGIDIASSALASDFNGYAGSADVTAYLTMPWLQHHTLALHAGGGASGGSRAGDGPFYIGGYWDYSILDVIKDSYVQGGIQLRGYPPAYLIGNYYGLFNAEYRFPIVNIDRGPSTLPLFFNRINGSAFVDYGSAFDESSAAGLKTGVGGELWFEMTFGYLLDFTFRLGHARGLASGGIDKTYFVAVVPF